MDGCAGTVASSVARLMPTSSRPRAAPDAVASRPTAPGPADEARGGRSGGTDATPLVSERPPSDAREGGQGLVAANVSVALGTLMSRLTGLLQIIVFGAIIGQNALADAYDGANNSPNSIYELLLGGVLSATLVPLFTEHLERNDEEATNAVLSVAVVGLAALTTVAVVAAPLVFGLFSISPSPSVDAGEYRWVGTALARVFLIQIFFYGLMALGSALLNARRRFFAPAWAPVLANLVVIGGLLLVPRAVHGQDPSLGLARHSMALRLLLGAGETIGIAAMALALIPALIRAGVRFRFSPKWRHPAVRKLATLSGWTLGYVAANQVALVVVRNLAKPGSGGQDAYSKAYAFFQLPHGLLAMSITTTFVPDLARFVARKDKPAFIARASLGIRLVALFTFPASLGLLVLARPIIGAFLEHGQFSEHAAVTTARALAGLAVGLVGFSVYLFVLRGFYAHQDTRTPFVINVGENLLNIVLALALVHRYGVMGLGLAFGIAYLVSAAWALQVLSYKVPGFELRPVFASLGRMLLASLFMAEVVWAIGRVVGSNSGAGAVGRVVIGVLVGIVTYVVVLLLLRAPELRAARRFLPAGVPGSLPGGRG
jgi:putative peptidoglycan lipid II flippase